MKKALSCILAIVFSVAALTSLTACSGDGVPDGMQLLLGGEDLGYYMYVPEEWTPANHGDIACAYASKVDNTSVSFVKAEKPEGSISDYFSSQSALFPFEITLTVENEKTPFGNAKSAYRFVYDYTYQSYGFRTMQVFVEYGEDFYIFTFNSYTRERTEGESYYQFYMEKVSHIIDNFKFVEKKTGNSEKPEYTRDGDGYILVSDKTLSGFEMYVPDAYAIDYSSGIVSVTREDGTNINLTKATYTGVDYNDYWQARREDIKSITGSYPTATKEGEVYNLSGVDWARAYEYSYTLAGEEYHAYQVLIVDGFDGFVFTYTAKSSELFAEHLNEALTVLGKVKF